MITLVIALVASMVAAAGATAAQQKPQPPAANPLSAAVASAERLVAGRVAELHPGDGEKYTRTQETSTPWGLQYITYHRTHRGLPVVGGDFVVTTDTKGNVRGLSVAQSQRINVGVTPKVDKAAAARTARGALSKPEAKQQDPRLVVHAYGKPRLAWESTVSGLDGKTPSRKNVYIDAITGELFDKLETVVAGTGNGAWSGSNVTIGTTQQGGQYTMRDPARPRLECADFSTRQVFSGPDDTWGNGSKTDKESGCVDVMYIGAGEWDLLKNWYGRNGLDGQGNWADAIVGLNEVNAYWGHQNNPDGAVFGWNSARQWITAADVVAHEFGHGLDTKTGGGFSGQSTGEFVADVWGALTEHYMNNPADTPDYTVGELANLQGNGPIRNMYKPSTISGHPDCYSSSVPSMPTHTAAGVGNHWFYLLAEGTNPGGGKPSSASCNGSTLTGIGIQEAGRIFYNAMLQKTSNSDYARYRVLTLTAAKNLDSSCGLYKKVKDAWDAVSLAAQSGEPTCTSTGNDFSMSVSPGAGSVQPGSSVQATVNTTVTGGSAQNVNLSATVSPSNPGVSVSLNPQQIQSGNTSTMTISATNTATSGSFTVTVTGAGSVTRTTSYNLTVGPGGPGPGAPPDISVDNVKAHLQQLQTIATNNGGTRRATSAGYTASVSYIEQKLQSAGFSVSRQNCTSGCSSGAGPNLVADWPGGSADNVYMFGAHLDSVAAGPGINDNGTGSAAQLEVALKLAQTNPTMLNHVRFAWWTDEEQGLNGSKFYVGQLPAAERSKIKGYFNFDMVGSPNPGYFLYGVNSPLSANLKGYFDSINVGTEEMSECCSDDGSFRNAGITTSFLSTGASATKSAAQAQKWGGTSGQAFDRCYHQACDSYPANIDTTALDRSSDAIAWAVWKVAVGSSPAPGDDFTLGPNPSSGSVQPGQSTAASINTSVIKGNSQVIDLTSTVSPSGPLVTFAPASVNAGNAATMSISTGSRTPAGNYTITITGTGKSVTRTATYTLTVQGTGGSDFSISVNPSSATVSAGQATSATVSSALVSGNSQTLSLTANVSPGGPTASLSPTSVTTGGSSTLTVTTTAGTAAGAYTVTITASGTVVRTATFSLTVQSGGPGNERTFTNDADFPIMDQQQIFSPVTSTADGAAANPVTVNVTVQHTCAEDIGISLVAPSGQIYPVKNAGGNVCTPWNGAATFTVPGVMGSATGRWQLAMYDYGPGDTGMLDSWSVTV
nr:M28 family peptidase [Kibdelosporangium sp. MJ126-NF4]